MSVFFAAVKLFTYLPLDHDVWGLIPRVHVTRGGQDDHPSVSMTPWAGRFQALSNLLLEFGGAHLLEWVHSVQMLCFKKQLRNVHSSRLPDMIKSALGCIKNEHIPGASAFPPS